MGQQYLTESEKELLTAIGRYPHMSFKELIDYTNYKRLSSIVRKVKELRERNILWGPVYTLDYGKLCKNPLHSLMCVIEFEKDYETIIEYLKLIEPLVWVYRVLSSHKEVLIAGFLSSDDVAVAALLQLLKDNSIIKDFIVRARCHRDVEECPNFFGDPVPPLDTLYDPCEPPDISFGQHDTKWNECDIRTLSYLCGGYESVKLVEILKKERKLHDRVWKYDQIKYSYRKMIKNKLIERRYYIHPFPLEQCADFFLFLRTEDIGLTLRILCNFAKGGRIYREYSLRGDWGLIGCICHPQFVIDLMHKLDQVDEIKEKELYHKRSFPPGIRYVGEYTEFTYYDVDTQTLEYPYGIFKERVKEKLESEK
ncbi:MAG: hypothetical protein HXS48_03930 [Theionarchaea archaeon]|nr:hypothetical protein [Theionarchaea archaeon]